MSWEVVVEPEGANPASGSGKNESGLAVYLANGDERKEEVARVLYVRRNSKNPRRTFKRQLRDVLDTAYEARDELNGMNTDAAQRREAAKARVEEIRKQMDEADADFRRAEEELQTTGSQREGATLAKLERDNV